MPSIPYFDLPAGLMAPLVPVSEGGEGRGARGGLVLEHKELVESGRVAVWG